MRVRILFAKDPSVRFVSHLDLARAWERALRRSGLPLKLAGEFNPHPRLVFAAPLPVGACGERELLDVHLARDMDLEELAAAVQAQLPDGLPLLGVRQVPDAEPALTAQANLAEYRWEPRGPSALGGAGNGLARAVVRAGAETGAGADREAEARADVLHRAVEAFFAAPACPVERKTKSGQIRTVDVRPLVRGLTVEGGWRQGGGNGPIEPPVPAVAFRAALGTEDAVRPLEVVAALGACLEQAFAPEAGLVTRGWLYHQDGEGRAVPLWPPEGEAP